MKKILSASLFAGLALSGTAALAQTTATATTDLNLRAGPGVQHAVIGMVGSGQEVDVAGCIDAANWCEITADGESGWAYGDYLNVLVGEEVVSLYPHRQEVGVTVIERPADTQGQDAAVGGVGGAAIGALVGGPIGAVAGAAIGGTAGAAASVEPEPEVTTYVTNNAVEPIYLEGEVVLGAGVPENVTLYDVPDYPSYSYAQINGQTVLVEPGARDIVYIYR